MKPDQVRVRTLLTDTVIMLCKSALVYKHNVSIQGVVGVTIDDEDVFLVHFDRQFYVNPPCKELVSTGTGVVSDTVSVDRNTKEPSASSEVPDSNGTHATVATKNPDDFTKLKKITSSITSSIPLLQSAVVKNKVPQLKNIRMVTPTSMGEKDSNAGKTSKKKKSVCMSSSSENRQSAKKPSLSARMSTFPSTMQVTI